MNPLRWTQREQVALGTSSALGVIAGLMVGFVSQLRCGLTLMEWMIGYGNFPDSIPWAVLGLTCGAAIFFLLHLNAPTQWRFIPPPPADSATNAAFIKFLRRVPTDEDRWAFEAAYRTCYVGIAMQDPSFRRLPADERVARATRAAQQRYVERLEEQIRRFDAAGKKVP